MTTLRRLGDLTVKVGSGATPRGGKAVYRKAGVAFIRSQNVLDNAMRLDEVAKISDEAADQLRGVTVQAGDVLLNITGDSIARVCLVDSAILPARVNQHVAIIRTGSELDERYLQRYLVQNSTKEHLLSISDGGTRKALTKASIESLLVPIPPLEVQRGIAEVLAVLDDKISANGELISSAVALMVALASSARSAVMLGEIVTQSKTQLRPDGFDAEVAHFSLPAFDVDQRPEHVTGSSIKSNKFVLDAPCVLVSKLNPRFPRVWNVSALPEQMALASTEFVVLRPEGVNVSELWSTLAQPDVATTLQGKVAGTSGSHQRVKPADILMLQVRDPRSLTNVQRTLLTKLGQIVNARREQSAKLAKMRDTLLPELMSGKIRVKDAEGIVGEAV